MPDSSKRNAIVLLIDGLNPCFLSPCGCTWIATPELDSLAAESVTFERSVVESTNSDRNLWSFLNGLHPELCEQNQSIKSSSGIEGLNDKIESVLFTDAEPAKDVAQSFNRVVQLTQPTADNPQSANDISETHLAFCFAEILTHLPKQTTPFLFVIHLASLTKVWDAPLSMRSRYRDEEDPEPPTMVSPPSLTGTIDPDTVLGVSHAYAAQLETLDACLGVLLNEARLDGFLDNSMIMLAGLNGFPVGYSGQVGFSDDYIGGDVTSVPMFVRPADKDAIRMVPARSHDLNSQSEWFEFVANYLEAGLQESDAALADDSNQQADAGDRLSKIMSGQICEQRNCVISIGDDARSIWTPAWLLVEDRRSRISSPRGAMPQLFVKPDDRWEVNSVQDRCRWIADELQQTLELACQHLSEGRSPAIESLAEELMSGLD